MLIYRNVEGIHGLRRIGNPLIGDININLLNETNDSKIQQ